MAIRKFTIEPHGDGFALYDGRDNEHHGYRLCNLNDFDSNGKYTRGSIMAAFTALEELANLKNDVSDGLSHISSDKILKMYGEVEKVYQEHTGLLS